MTGPLVFKLADLPPGGLEVPLDVGPDILEKLIADAADEGTRILSPLTGQLRLQKNGRRLLVSGRFDVRVESPCDRCLALFPLNISGRIDEVFDLDEGLGPEHETGEDEELLPVRDGRVDLNPYLGEFFWLAWPYRRLCREDCRGLCPMCGADLNDGPCGCGNNAI